MFARRFQARVVSVNRLTSSVIQLLFAPDRGLDFLGGQYVSLYVPTETGFVRRPYSLAGPNELCIKVYPDGLGSRFVESLRPGDRFEAMGAYGHFVYRKPEAGRSVCFIGTGTGLAPLKAIIESREFRRDLPSDAILLQGARTQADLLYKGVFDKAGIREVHALSQPGREWAGFRGRVTDFLRSLPSDWPWKDVDFYLCGNADMVLEVERLLVHGRGVPKSSVFHEIFQPSNKLKTAAWVQPFRKTS